MAFSRRFFLRIGSLSGIGLAMRTVLGRGKSYAEEPLGTLATSPTASATCTPFATALPGSTATPLDWVKYAGQATHDAFCPFFGELLDDDQNDKTYWGNNDPNKVLTRRILEHLNDRLANVTAGDYQKTAKILGSVVRLLQRVLVVNQSLPQLTPCDSTLDDKSMVFCRMEQIDDLVRGIYAQLVKEHATPTPTPTACPTPTSTPSSDAAIICVSKDVVAIAQAIAAALPGHFEIAAHNTKTTGSKG